MNFIKLRCITLLFAPCLLLGCKTSKTNLVEPVKDISGDWKVTKVIQNNVDITAFVTDLQQFTITFNKDNTYKLTGQLPFMVSQSGNWAFNDPQYPFALSFTPMGGTVVSSNISFPIVGEGYQIGLKFTTGCNGVYQNNYQYTLNPVTK